LLKYLRFERFERFEGFSGFCSQGPVAAVRKILGFEVVTVREVDDSSGFGSFES